MKSFHRKHWLLIFLFEIVSCNLLENCTFADCDYNTANYKVLSRRKRYLLFPKGSSFQLVFCLQTSAIIAIGDIFLFGNTAALAWPLPTDPMFVQMFGDNLKSAQRRGDEIHYVNSEGKLVAKTPYKRAPINPIFVKRGVGNPYKEKLKAKLEQIKLQQNKGDFLDKNHLGLGESVIEFHRNSRVELYGKIEKLLNVMGRSGKLCVLRKLCEASRRSPQGTFLQELLRVVFTLPKGKEFQEDEHKEYDKAHTADEECDALYPCDTDIPLRF